MLLQFNVRNFLSFRDETVFNLVANNRNEHEEILIKYGDKTRVLPFVAVFGSNASGKSNLFKALTSAIMFVRTSNRKQVNEPNFYISPFLFDHEHKKLPTEFNFIFVYEGIKYEYGFAADFRRVHKEYLYVFKTQKPSLIFNRENTGTGDKYEFSITTKAELNKLCTMNSENKLFLATATAWNSEFTKPAFLWFSEQIDTVDPDSLYGGLAQSLDYNKDPELPKFMRELLQNADINISDYKFESKIIDDPNKISLLRRRGLIVDPLLVKELKEFKITTKHSILVDDRIEEFDLDLLQESNGTKKIFAYGPIIKNALEKGKTIAIDEIDNGLHPLLVKYLVSLFNNPEVNKKGAQLLINTHDVNLLNSDAFRRDQFYFVEKDFTTGISELYSLDEFPSSRESGKIEENYLMGRYGAIPNIN